MSTKSREERIEHKRKYCQHYDAGGVTMIGGKHPSGHCLVGVVYLDQFGRAPKDDPRSHISGLGYYESSGIFQRMCCTSGGKPEEEQLAACPKWERTTQEQAEAQVDDGDAAWERFKVVMTEVSKWRTWSKKNRVGKAEVIKCPACAGRLHLSQAAYNGHVHGHCETAGCVSWME